MDNSTGGQTSYLPSISLANGGMPHPLTPMKFLASLIHILVTECLTISMILVKSTTTLFATFKE